MELKTKRSAEPKSPVAGAGAFVSVGFDSVHIALLGTSDRELAGRRARVTWGHKIRAVVLLA